MDWFVPFSPNTWSPARRAAPSLSEAAQARLKGLYDAGCDLKGLGDADRSRKLKAVSDIGLAVERLPPDADTAALDKLLEGLSEHASWRYTRCWGPGRDSVPDPDPAGAQTDALLLGLLHHLWGLLGEEPPEEEEVWGPRSLGAVAPRGRRPKRKRGPKPQPGAPSGRRALSGRQKVEQLQVALREQEMERELRLLSERSYD